MNNIFLDLDGTLTDPAVGIVRSLQHCLAQLGGPSVKDADLKQFIGPALRDAIKVLFKTDDPALIEAAVASYRDRFERIGMFENRVYPGIVEALTRIRDDDARLFVVTAKPSVFAERIINHFDLGDSFERVYGSDLSGERSSKSELIDHLLTTEAIESTNALMVGDRRHDVEGAHAHGIRCLGVLWGYGDREELEDAGADSLVEAPADLPRAIRTTAPYER